MVGATSSLIRAIAGRKLRSIALTGADAGKLLKLPESWNGPRSRRGGRDW